MYLRLSKKNSVRFDQSNLNHTGTDLTLQNANSFLSQHCARKGWDEMQEHQYNLLFNRLRAFWPKDYDY